MTDLSVPQRIDVSGVDVAYRQHGSGEHLLVLHGMGMTGSWLNFHEALAARFDVIAPEQPGFGATPRPAWHRTLDDAVPVYADLLDALGVASVHVAGHSLGALVAGAFAATYPERVRSLTLIAPVALPVVTPAELLEGHDGPPPPNLGELLFNDPDPGLHAEFEPIADFGALVAEPDDDEHADPNAFALEVAPGLYRRLARIRGPRQILVPDEDRLFPASIASDWARWLGEAPVITIEGGDRPTGHVLIVQQPEAIAERIASIAG